ncbi:hypothetical protein [Microvirga antarctica]|uniref:hypothetical protein n=1 Tax=Microvirga antarctica TaxID=2819233 RepID=UPI001B3078F2|nr:hypothetical protein [Microvirga antarctica]
MMAKATTGIGRTLYSPVGSCIYCGRSNCSLSLEHIVPESLNGTLELPAASCEECQKTINRYEQRVGREIFGDFRIRFNMRSKRSKSKRPSTIEVGTVSADGSLLTETISRSSYPAPIFFYKFGRASILRGLPAETGIFEWIPYVIHASEAFETFHRTHPKAVFKSRISPVELARTLAKIGYGYAVATIGLESFEPLPEVLDTILCRTEDVAFTVGSDLKEGLPMASEGHVLNLRCHWQHHKAPLLIVDIRLFAELPTPTFHVVVGRVSLTTYNAILR